jgi:hypothetical protein
MAKKHFFVTRQNHLGKMGGQSFAIIFEKKTSNLGLRLAKFGH